MFSKNVQTDMWKPAAALLQSRNKNQRHISSDLSVLPCQAPFWAC